MKHVSLKIAQTKNGWDIEYGKMKVFKEKKSFMTYKEEKTQMKRVTNWPTFYALFWQQKNLQY